MKFLKKLTLFIIVGTLISAYFILQTPSMLKISNPYQKLNTGILMESPFLESNRGLFGYALVSENNFLKLYLNSNTTQFAVIDKRNDHVWYSSVFTSDTSATLTTRNLQKSTIALRYLETDNTTKSINNYELSILPKTFEIIQNDDGFKIIYTLSDSLPKGFWFPTEISADRFEEKIINPFYNYEFDEFEEFTRAEMLRVLNNYYRVKEDDTSVYRLTIIRQDQTASDIGKIEVEELFYLFYVIGTYGNDIDEAGQYLETYNFDDVIFDNTQFGFEKRITNPEFVIPLKVTLNEDHLEVFVDHHAIIEKEPYEIISLRVLPYFGAQSLNVEGYMLVPEGSGALIELNNNKTTLRNYETFVYGKDMTNMNPLLSVEDIGSKMPIYGIQANTNSFLAIVEDGQHKLKITAEISGKSDRFNKVIPEYTFRDEGIYFLTDNGVKIWNQDRNLHSISTKYYFFSEEEANYSSMAHLYGKYLASIYQMMVQNEFNRGIALDIVGSYDLEDYFLFFPYKKIETLTTFKEAEIILQYFIDENIDTLDISFIGWFNDGIHHKIASNVEIDSVMGSIDDLIAFDQNNDNVNIYFDVNYMTAYQVPPLYSDQNFSRIVGGSINEQFPYDISSRLQNLSKEPTYYLKYQTIQENMLKTIDDFDKHNINSISLRQLGNTIYSDFHRGFYINRSDALNFQESALFNLSTQKNLMLNFPNTYAIAFAEYIKDMSFLGSNQRIVDQSIPFYQIAIAPYKRFSIPSINMNQREANTYYLFKAIETGAQLKFTLTYDDTSHLIQTPYNLYLATQFDKNKDTIIDLYNRHLKILGNQSYIINHTYVSDDIVIVTYSDQTTIELNYKALTFRIL